MKQVDKDRADRVIEIFNNSKLNQRQFAELIGVSQQLVSAVVNYTKKPNETILLAILDNIEDIDPMWLFTGIKSEKPSTPSQNDSSSKFTSDSTESKIQYSPLEEHIKEIVKDQIRGLSKNILQRLANIEDSVKNSI